MLNEYVERARSFVGCRFRPQGRDEATGLDCIGLIAAVFRIPAEQIPGDYGLRGAAFARIRNGLSKWFRALDAGRTQAGDVLLFAVAPDQPHVAIRTENGFVHAHAGQKRVVETPGAACWPLIGAFRFTGESRS